MLMGTSKMGDLDCKVQGLSKGADLSKNKPPDSSPQSAAILQRNV